MTNKRCLVFETLGAVKDLQIVESAKDEMRLTGVFGVCGVKNQNNRIYDKTNYAQMVESLQKVIAEEGCPGELEHPNSMNIDLNNVSHKIESIQMNEDGTITGTILLLNTPKGQIAKALVEGGLPLFISSRGAGTITNEGRVTLSTIKTYDLVGTPGFSQAKLTLKPNQTVESLNESLDDGNIMYAIVEGDDSVDPLEDDPDDKKDDDSDKKDDSTKKDESGKDDDSDDKKDDDSDKKDDSDDKENKDNKNNKDIDMNDLKEAIDKLADRVESLEANLHVAKESLQPNYEAIEKWVNEEFAPEFKSSIIEETENKMNESLDKLAENVQTWVVEEFAPEVQNWVVEEFSPEVQNWVTEEFAPEVQNWVVEEFSPEVQNWVVEEFSPVIEGWVTEEFAPVVEGWVTEEFAEDQMKKVNESVSAYLAENNSARLSEIDSLLETISNDSTPVNEIVKESQTNKRFTGVFCVEHMPAEYKPSFELLTEQQQDEIVRTSKMYDFTKEGVLESFWANVDFSKKEDKKDGNQPVNIIESYHSRIAQQMKRLNGTF